MVAAARNIAAVVRDAAIAQTPLPPSSAIAAAAAAANAAINFVVVAGSCALASPGVDQLIASSQSISNKAPPTIPSSPSFQSRMYRAPRTE